MPSRKWRAFFCPKDSVRSFGARFARPGMFAKDVRARRRTTMGLVARKQISVPFIITFGGKGLRLLQSSLPCGRLDCNTPSLPAYLRPACAGGRKYGRLAALLPAAIRAACAAIGTPIRRAFRLCAPRRCQNADAIPLSSDLSISFAAYRASSALEWASLHRGLTNGFRR